MSLSVAMVKAVGIVIVASLLCQTADCLSCFVCKPDHAKHMDSQELRHFKNVPACSAYRKAKRADFIKECPADAAHGCVTKFERNGSILRTCTRAAVDDCKEINGVTYCYCDKDLCNTPERKLSEPGPGAAEAESSTSITAGAVTAGKSSVKSLMLDQMNEGSGDFYDDEEENNDLDKSLDYSDVTEPTQSISQELEKEYRLIAEKNNLDIDFEDGGRGGGASGGHVHGHGHEEVASGADGRAQSRMLWPTAALLLVAGLVRSRST